jgi:hypothetical protein
MRSRPRLFTLLEIDFVMSTNEPMELDMSTNLTFAPRGLPWQSRFVLVNDRIPRTEQHCALCGGIVEKSYVQGIHRRG